MNIFNYGICFVEYWLLLEISWMNPIITFIILISSAQFLYHAKLQAILILSLFGVACSVVCEFICVATLSTLLMSKIQAVLQTTHGLLLTSITSRFLLFLSNQIIKVYVQCKTRANNYRISFVFISPIISMFIMYSLLEFDQFLPHTPKYSIWLSSIYFILLIMNLIVFKIYDDKQKYYIIADENITLKTLGAIEKEKEVENLWVTFFNTIGIKERKNTRCQMNFMPKKYWKYIIEMEGAYEKSNNR